MMLDYDIAIGRGQSVTEALDKLVSSMKEFTMLGWEPLGAHVITITHLGVLATQNIIKRERTL